ncbi:BON domain-containing protein [Achromobacter aloeverae]|uniref:Phospholipid-binding protein n=1 Tax=Achromobacter aloeverae TaxID=1750518 RepID=A0A4Q1HJR4_9BURK|nr:BON domain-containing protein [Achromobacter aloeverae]RXN90330.1 phospholipid-binding protein [Achromobacter aloeverae]
MTRNRTRTALLALVLAGATLTLSACIAPVVVGGAAAGTAVVVTDRRSSGVQLDDQNLGFKVQHAISQKLGDTVRVDANVYEGQVLLTGDAPTEAAKTQATAIAKAQDGVKTIYNEMVVGQPASFGTRSNDTWLSSKVRTSLLNTKFVPSGSISVTTDRSVVFLQGKVTQTEGDYAANAAAEVSGVHKVVKLFKTISREEAVHLSGSYSDPTGTSTKAPGSAPVENAPGADSTAGGAGGGAVESLPIK